MFVNLIQIKNPNIKPNEDATIRFLKFQSSKSYDSRILSYSNKFRCKEKKQSIAPTLL